MRRRCAFSVLFILAAVCASAQSGPVKVLVRSGTQPASAGPDVQAIARYFENHVAELLATKHPCADVVTMGDLANLLDHDRQRQLLGGKDEGVLDAVAGAVGANYVISLSVAPIDSGRVSLTGFMMNAANAQTVARETMTTAGGSAAVEGVEALAQRLVQSLGTVSRFSKEKCEPTNPWTGTVTYKAVRTRRDESTGKSPTDEGTITSTRAVDFSYEAMIRIGWTGEPKVQVVAKETTRIEEVAKITRDCGRPGVAGRNVPNPKSAGYRNLDVIESSAAGDGDTVASVSVSLAGGKIKLHLSVSAVEGTSRARSQKRFDGGCGDPTSSDQTSDYPWQSNALGISSEVEAPASSQRPDQQSGSVTIDGGEATVTWKLTRTPMRK